jgi:hypothetical protein
VSAGQIIDAFKQLPPDEQARVADFVRKFDKGRQLSGKQLGNLAKEMVETEDPEKKSRVRERIVKGFYGD